MPASHFSLRFC
jgi:hypothetical protein